LPARIVAFERAHRELIRAELPYWARRGSGYALAHLLPEHGSRLDRALVGTEGTCAVLLEATVRLIAPPPAGAPGVTGVPGAGDAPELLAHGPLTMEGLDTGLLTALRGRSRPELPEGAAWLLVEFGADELGAALASAQAVAAEAGRPSLVVTDPGRRAALWRI